MFDFGFKRTFKIPPMRLSEGGASVLLYVKVAAHTILPFRNTSKLFIPNFRKTSHMYFLCSVWHLFNSNVFAVLTL